MKSTGNMGENSWPSCRQLQDLMVEKNVKDITELAPGGIAELCRRLGTDPERGLPDPVVDWDRRVEVYGRNWVAEKKVKSYWHFAWEAVQEKIVLLLLFIGTVELLVEMIFKPEERHEAWIEPVAIYVTVCIIVNVQAFMDWRRECLFDNLSKQVAASNLRYVIRGGKQINLKDEEVVVGDVLTFNSHLAAMIPADGLMIAGEGVKMDESALTGEPEPMVKDAATKPFMVSGTMVNAGQGKMLVICVGDHSVSGKIRKAVYDANGEESEPSPLFVKLDTMATQLGRVGTAVAVIVFITACIEGFAIHHEKGEKVIDYALLAFGILAVAVPEGLPLALTIALAISSNKMSAENNLVKTLDSCETMGSVTTICTDKTGTLTANRMTVQAASLGGVLFKPMDNSPLGPRVHGDDRLSSGLKDLTSNLVAVCTMDESQVMPPESGSSEPTFVGNPTECAMLHFINTAGYDYEQIRKQTVGRSTSTRDKGAARAFSSARKMMSWAVPRDGGGYRVYAKGASEIILDRVTSATGPKGEVRDLSDAEKEKITSEVIGPFAKLAFRTIGLAYKDVDTMPDDTLHAVVLNSDGSSAFLCETGLTLLGVFGIADPLRLEVPGAIRQCYTAGIDVRMVTGDNLVTAIAIARKAGILDEALHFTADGEIKPKRAMEGRTFRKAVYATDDSGEPIFQQDKFDEIWPYLRVLARSSPEDKLTLAKGLAASRLFADARKCRQLKLAENINIFPDSQVIAMTGDGTNDAPALKAADVGFAMGIAGTQISKDAANIILMDDNFASIVLAAKWGRNVFDSIQKFLQFQLTVNFAIVVISLLVSFSGIEAPLKLLHLLWLNMIMDSLAALAIANEPPTEDQLKRPPVNRSASIFTEQMWYNMIGQALYQIFLVLMLLFSPSFLPDLPGPGSSDPYTGAGSRHYTMIFNMFVLFQLFNEYNCRFLLGEFNILRGLQNNLIFVGISLTTFVLQVLMTQFAGPVMKIHPKGLTGKQWGVCIGLGAGPLVWQPILNLSRMGLNKIAFWLQSVRRGHARAASAGSHGIPVGRSSLSSASVGGMDKE